MAAGVDLSHLKRPPAPYVTDPPSAASSGKPTLKGTVFDQARLRDAMARGLMPDAIPAPLPAPYGDERLIAIVMGLGMPRWSAEQMRGHPGLRFAYFSLALDVEAAARGDKPAKERVDAVRWKFQEDRKAERVSDVPDRATGYVAT